MALTEQEKAAQQKEVDENFKFFKKKVHALERHHRGKYALLRKKKLIAVYDTLGDALMTGETFFEDKRFSIQKIDSRPVQFINREIVTREIA